MNIEINFKKLKNHFDILATTDGSLKYSLVDKNRVIIDKTPETDKEATIITLQHSKEENINDHFCDWWKQSKNREYVTQWFSEKYEK